MRRLRVINAAALAIVLAACSSGDGSGGDGAPTSDAVAATSTGDTVTSESPATDAPVTDPPATEPSATDTADNDPAEPEVDTSETDDSTDDRPFDVFVPSGYDPAAPTPLILLLHGYTGSGESQEAYFNFEPLAESRGFLYVHPDGTVDARGEQFWNATDACCAFGNAIDDEAYLLSIIEQVSADYNVDPNAVFLAGHSNGGFMSYRMACRHADKIAGIASLAGATFADPTECTPSEPVSVLQVHGTNDETIAYDGGSIIGNDYPSARQTVDFWAAYNGCDPTPTSTEGALDLDDSIDGDDSDVDAVSGCEQDVAVELWTIDGGRHVPPVTAEFSASVVDFLLAHPKPLAR